MALTTRYLVSQKNVPLIFDKIISGAIPDKFTQAHLEGLGFASSNDRGFLGLLKDIGFLSSDGVPTQRYKDYRDRSRSKQVLGEALRQAYSDLFLINETGLSRKDKDAIVGRFKSTHGSNDNIAALQANTFLSLLDLADISAGNYPLPAPYTGEPKSEGEASSPKTKRGTNVDLRYTIQIHLPATKEVEVFNAIFKSLKQHLLDE